MLEAPLGLSHPQTSFIGTVCQGIHHTPSQASPVSTGRLHPSRDFHLRPIKHVFNMRATTVQDRTES